MILMDQLILFSELANFLDTLAKSWELTQRTACPNCMYKLLGLKFQLMLLPFKF